jgi:hypothetical protein
VFRDTDDAEPWLAAQANESDMNREPRGGAVQCAEEERKAIEKGGPYGD